jgi:hypothetical protein
MILDAFRLDGKNGGASLAIWLALPSFFALRPATTSTARFWQWTGAGWLDKVLE